MWHNHFATSAKKVNAAEYMGLLKTLDDSLTTFVRDGFYGDEPSLTDLVNDDLKVTTGFRDVYHELLSHTLGADPAPAVGSGRRDLGFL
ncbi:MAG: hypothetical protein JO152_00170 [Mycobacteriaceae bacterium]|nr:hypothetical protein [Mycobacteriaceae bacterium]